MTLGSRRTVPKATGLFSRALMDSIKRAEVLQANAVLAIKEGYGVIDDPKLEIENLTWEKFNEVLDRADKNGTRDQLEEELRQMVANALVQITTQPQQQVE